MLGGLGSFLGSNKIIIIVIVIVVLIIIGAIVSVAVKNNPYVKGTQYGLEQAKDLQKKI